ncbi:MAG TPA: radical SAM protein [Candidatus Binatia bacterium]|nr:radical SAM protein [Candidatus Binatia bacterium]
MSALRYDLVIHPAALKIELAVRGVRLDPSVQLARTDEPIRSLDLVLPDGVSVDVPLDERQSEGSPWALVAEGGRHFVIRHDPDAAETRVAVRTVARPRFYDRRTSRGTPMRRIASRRGRHLLVTPTTACGFSVRGAPCRFCVEGGRLPADREAVPIADVVETVRAAFDEGVGQLVWFNTAHFESEDGGIAFLAPYVEAVRRHFDTLVAVQVHPPRSERWIDQTYAMGVDAVSYNLEIFDDELLKRHCVGRARYIGRDRYLAAMAHAARVFPSGTVWSDLALGLEPPQSTIAGIDALVEMGVLPVAALVRGEYAPPPIDDAAAVLAHLYRAVKGSGINMGWVRDLALCITPFEARHFAGDGARVAVTLQNLTDSRLGALAARGLARVRRRIRVRKASDSGEAAH